MSVVAWDGKCIAADRQMTCNDMRMLTTKMRRLDDGTVLAWTGLPGAGLMLVRWYVEGKEWPDGQQGENWSRLIVAKKDRVEMYERYPVPILVESAFMAWGSGQEFALGAMAMGATAIQAVDVANRFSVNCGFGVEWYDLTQ
jgi:ATP-dependent protease HslVU (ClpYQ) peptidase subunit